MVDQSSRQSQTRRYDEYEERRAEILSPPESVWTAVGALVLIVGAVITGYGLYFFFSGGGDPGAELGGIVAALYGPTIIIVGILFALLGILCIIAGINRRSEQRLEAIQLLTREQSHYQKAITGALAEWQDVEYRRQLSSLVEETPVEGQGKPINSAQ